jgi:beta-phosphoglucomutase-like phosphatase (HAD superfamily)
MRHKFGLGTGLGLPQKAIGARHNYRELLAQKVVAYDWDCTLSVMPRGDRRRRDGLDHSSWVADNVRQLILDLHKQGVTQAIVSYADSATILASLRGAGLDKAIPARLVLTPDVMYADDGRAQRAWRRDEDGRPLKSEMMRHLMELVGSNDTDMAQRRRFMLVDDLPRNIDDVRAAGFDALPVPDRRYDEGAHSHNECPGVAGML